MFVSYIRGPQYKKNWGGPDQLAGNTKERPRGRGDKQKLICVCARNLFVCGPRIKFCALAQTWVVTQSLVSEKRSEWLTLLVKVQIIMATTNKQWN